jgi:hypothetical protein
MLDRPLQPRVFGLVRRISLSIGEPGFTRGWCVYTCVTAAILYSLDETKIVIEQWVQFIQQRHAFRHRRFA